MEDFWTRSCLRPESHSLSHVLFQGPKQARAAGQPPSNTPRYAWIQLPRNNFVPGQMNYTPYTLHRILYTYSYKQYNIGYNTMHRIPEQLYMHWTVPVSQNSIFSNVRSVPTPSTPGMFVPVLQACQANWLLSDPWRKKVKIIRATNKEERWRIIIYLLF